MTRSVGWSFLRSRRWIGYFALLAVFSVICVLLGNWQFARRAEAQAEIARIDQNYDADPVPVEQLLPNQSAFDLDEHKWRPVVMTGTYLASEQLLVRNRPVANKIGYEILTPLRLASGSVFLVDRGWIPQQSGEARAVNIPEPPEGVVTVTARLKAGEPTIAGRVPESQTVGTINLPEIQGLINEPMNTSAYGLLIEEQPSAAHGELALRPERDEGPHLSYALQWYVFIVIAIAGTVYGARQEYRSLNPASEGAQTSGMQTLRARKQPRRSDAEDEDALLDAQQRL